MISDGSPTDALATGPLRPAALSETRYCASETALSAVARKELPCWNSIHGAVCPDATGGRWQVVVVPLVVHVQLPPQLGDARVGPTTGVMVTVVPLGQVPAPHADITRQ